MSPKTAESTDPIAINKANVVKKLLVLERQHRYEAPVNMKEADTHKQSRERMVKELFQNFPAEATSGLNNSEALSSEVAYLHEFIKRMRLF